MDQCTILGYGTQCSYIWRSQIGLWGQELRSAPRSLTWLHKISYIFLVFGTRVFCWCCWFTVFTLSFGSKSGPLATGIFGVHFYLLAWAAKLKIRTDCDTFEGLCLISSEDISDTGKRATLSIYVFASTTTTVRTLQNIRPLYSGFYSSPIVGLYLPALHTTLLIRSLCYII